MQVGLGLLPDHVQRGLQGACWVGKHTESLALRRERNKGLQCRLSPCHGPGCPVRMGSENSSLGTTSCSAPAFQLEFHWHTAVVTLVHICVFSMAKIALNSKQTIRSSRLNIYYLARYGNSSPPLLGASPVHRGEGLCRGLHGQNDRAGMRHMDLESASNFHEALACLLGVGGKCREGTSWADPRSPHHIDGTPGPAGKTLKQLQSAEALEAVGTQQASFPWVPFPPPTHFSDHSSLARHPSLPTSLSQWVSMPLGMDLTARVSREPLSLVTILAPRAPLLLQPGCPPGPLAL